MDARRSPATDAHGPLLRAARRGDHRALETLYRGHAPTIVGYLRGAGAREPEDLASEVFIGMIRGLRRFRGDADDFRGWLFTIARRRLQDERRRAVHRLQRPMAPDSLPGLLSTDPEPEDVALARLEAHAVLAALEDLTSDQRDVLLLRMVADLPVARVADMLGKSEPAVKMLQRRATARLRALLDRRVPDPVT